MKGATVPPGRAAEAELAAAYRGYWVRLAQGRDGPVLEAQRREPGRGPFAVVSASVAEVRSELEAGLRAELIALQREYPAAAFSLWTGNRGRRGFAAVLPLAGPEVYAVITTDAAELRAELAAAGAGPKTAGP